MIFPRKSRGTTKKSRLTQTKAGGLTAGFTILFAQLALPASDLAVILSLTSILDFVATATNVFAGQCMLAITARSIDKTAENG